MPKYRKKPVVIEAVRVAELIQNARYHWEFLPTWVRAHYEDGGIIFMNDGIDVRTLEGRMRADKKDWLILGVKGEIYPCKPDIFEATYEFVEE